MSSFDINLTLLSLGKVLQKKTRCCGMWFRKNKCASRTAPSYVRWRDLAACVIFFFSMKKQVAGLFIVCVRIDSGLFDIVKFSGENTVPIIIIVYLKVNIVLYYSRLMIIRVLVVFHSHRAFLFSPLGS